MFKPPLTPNEALQSIDEQILKMQPMIKTLNRSIESTYPLTYDYFFYELTLYLYSARESHKIQVVRAFDSTNYDWLREKQQANCSINVCIHTTKWCHTSTKIPLFTLFARIYHGKHVCLNFEIFQGLFLDLT